MAVVITVKDTLPPSFTPRSAVTLYLDNDGNAAVPVDSVIVSGSVADNCTVYGEDISEYVTITPNSFNCGDIGAASVTVEVRDHSGNSTSYTVGLTVADTVKPKITCVTGIQERSTDGGCSYTVVGVEFDPVVEVRCGNTITHNYNGGGTTLAGTVLPAGDYPIVWTVTGAGGETATCSYTISVTDGDDPPTFDLTASTVTVYIDADNGYEAYLTAAEMVTNIDAGCTDESVIVNPVNELLWLNRVSEASTYTSATFTRADVGTPVAMEVTAKKSAGAAAGTPVAFTVIVLDTITPVLTCAPAATLSIPALPLGTCSYTINVTTYDATADPNSKNGSFTIAHDYTSAPSSLTLNGTELPAGTHTITWTLTNEAAAGTPTRTCETTLTVENTNPPVLSCTGDTTMVLNGSDVTFTAESLVDLGETISCSPLTYTFQSIGGSPAATYDCSQLGGPYALTVWAVDTWGNEGSCTVNIYIEDQTPPEFTVAEIERNNVPLDPATSMTAPLDVEDFRVYVQGDNCTPNGDITLSLHETEFTCPSTYTWLVAEDASHNKDSIKVIINIADNNPPVLMAKNITVDITSSSGTVTVTPEELLDAVRDDCTTEEDLVAALAFDPASQYEFTCADLGLSPVSGTLTVQDAAGNTATATYTITLINKVKPAFTTPSAITVQVNVAGGCEPDISPDATGKPVLVPSTCVNASDTTTRWVDDYSARGTDPANSDYYNYDIIREWTVGIAGRSDRDSTDMQIITVSDTEAPVLALKDTVTLTLDADRLVTLTNDLFLERVTDCADSLYVAIELSQVDFDCDVLGDNLSDTLDVDVVAVDPSGNRSTTYTLVVVVNAEPVLDLNTEITLDLEGATTVELLPDKVVNGVANICGIDIEGFDVTLSPSTFSCEHMHAPNTVTVTILDAQGETLADTTVTVIVRNSNAAARLKYTISLTSDKPRVDLNDQLTYVLEVTNTDVCMPNAWVEFALPEGVNYTAATGDGIYENGVWTFGALAQGESATMTVSAEVAEKISTLLTSTACVVSDSYDEPWNKVCTEYLQQFKDTSTVIEKTLMGRDVANVGDVVTYQLTVTTEVNEKRLTIVDSLPRGLFIVPAGLPSGSEINEADNVVIIHIDSLLEGTTATYSLQARVDSAGVFVNKAYLLRAGVEIESAQAVPLNALMSDIAITAEIKEGDYDSKEGEHGDVYVVSKEYSQIINLRNEGGGTIHSAKVETNYDPSIQELMWTNPSNAEIRQESATKAIITWTVAGLAGNDGYTLEAHFNPTAPLTHTFSTDARVESPTEVKLDNNDATVKVNQKIWKIPNVLMPESCLHIKELEDPYITTAALTVVNAWGNQVYHSKDYKVDQYNFDSAFNGVSLSKGTYWYYMEVYYEDGRNVVIRGYVEVLK